MVFFECILHNFPKHGRKHCVFFRFPDLKKASHLYDLKAYLGDQFTYVIFLDKGEPPRTGTATVRLYTLNKNDEPPKFSQQVYFISHVACITNIN